MLQGDDLRAAYVTDKLDTIILQKVVMDKLLSACQPLCHFFQLLNMHTRLAGYLMTYVSSQV